MQYKYKKGQIFGKKLPVPRFILLSIYNNNLPFNEYIEYDLEDKIPITCLSEEDRKIIEKFGIERAKQLDWELLIKSAPNALNKKIKINLKEILMTFDVSTENINEQLYELIKNQLPPSSYTKKMKEKYPNRFFDISENDVKDTEYYIKYNFNDGRINFDQIISNWEWIKEKDLSYNLLNDKLKELNVTDNQLKEIMTEYGIIISLLPDNKTIYSFIKEVNNSNTEYQKYHTIKQYSDSILKEKENIALTNDEYRELFKYSSLKDYIININGWAGEKLINELEKLPEGYLFSTHIPFSVVKDEDVIKFLGIYGYKNTVDFDNENNNFFTRNNYEALKKIYELYILNGQHNNYEIDKKLLIHSTYENVLYTKEEFHEVMRRIFKYGATEISKSLHYGNITGEFRNKNPELFISQHAPEEIQTAFYTKNFNSQLLSKYPDAITYLKDKEFSNYFNPKLISIEERKLVNLYEFLDEKYSFDEKEKFLIDYKDVLDIVLEDKYIHNSRYATIVSNEASIEEIEIELNKNLRKFIVELGKKYPQNVPERFIKSYPAMFLSEDAPKDLQEAFYNREIDSQFILSNPSYIKWLKDAELEVIYKYIPVYSIDGNNLYGFIKDKFKEDAFDITLLYGKYIEKLNQESLGENKISSLNIDYNDTPKDILTKFDTCIVQAILDGKIKYDESMPQHLKTNNPKLFLSENTDKEIKEKFYNRKFTLNDFNNNPELLEIFGDTNVACGFEENLSWIIPLFDKMDNQKIANYNRLKTISEYNKIQDSKLKSVFKEYVIDYKDSLNKDKIDLISQVLKRISDTNSPEMFMMRKSLAHQVINTDDPIDTIEKIEKIFIKNNLPLYGKVYSCFQILYPTLEKFNFDDVSHIAPQLKNQSIPSLIFGETKNDTRFNIIYNDLLRIAYRSGSRDFIEYLDNIEVGNEIYKRLEINNFDLSNLSKDETKSLEIFTKHLETLYYNTVNGKNQDLTSIPLDEKVKILGNYFVGNSRYELKDRIIRSFCYSAGIDSFDKLKRLTIESVKEADERGRKYAEGIENGKVFKLEKGDFVRGIGYYDILGSSLDSGNISKEHLTVFNQSSTTDFTPLDVDISLVKDNTNIYDAVFDGPSKDSYGNIYVVFKKDNPNFNITRDGYGNLTNAKYDPSKIEMFSTKVNMNQSENIGEQECHWGGRTGFAFTDVDYILYKRRLHIDFQKPYDENGNVNYEPSKDKDKLYDDLPAIKFEIARNGYYIPVVDFTGKLIFTVNEYEELREKMAGLSYYKTSAYTFSDNLDLPNIESVTSELESSEKYTKDKRRKINEIFNNVLEKFGLDLKEEMDGDLTPGSIELIDTGSTGRNTNVPYKGDFDFLLRVDQELKRDEEKYNKFKGRIKEELTKYPCDSTIVTDKGDYRLKGVQIDEDTTVDIDISFAIKTNKIVYSTDECLKDRLETIRKQDPEKYEKVVANIIYAKQYLKEAKVYKARRGENPQGGLGGIGIENWILQNNGSFIDATNSFLKTAEGKSFEEFKKVYQIWDFGENHFAARSNDYLHDNFVENNMSEAGYNKMCTALTKFKQKLAGKKDIEEMFEESENTSQVSRAQK